MYLCWMLLWYMWYYCHLSIILLAAAYPPLSPIALSQKNNPNKFLVPPCFSYFFSSCTCREIEKVFLIHCCYEGGNKLGLNFKIQNPYNFRLLQRLWTFIYQCKVNTRAVLFVSDFFIWVFCMCVWFMYLDRMLLW